VRIPPADRPAILEALARFDSQLRGHRNWVGWENRLSYKWALAHRGKQYPPKIIIELATGYPRSGAAGYGGFSGGDEANRYLRLRGFSILSVEREPEGGDGPTSAHVGSPDDSLPDSLKPFAPKSDESYLVAILGGNRPRSRRHESLVNDFAQWLRSKGYKPARNAAIDIGLNDPPAIFEAEYIKDDDWPAMIREAVGQLYEYRFFRVARPDAAAIFVASEPIPQKWWHYLEDDRGIYLAWREADGFFLSTKARSAIRML
jgi:hypothetical protein